MATVLTDSAKRVVFSDIDGTLINFTTYGYEVTAVSVRRLLATGIPLVLCSSKTRSEQAALRQALRIPDPFIVENGSAIVVPRGYFTTPFEFQRQVDDELVIELGVPAAAIRTALTQIRAALGMSFLGYADMTVAQVSAATGLDAAAAARACDREYSETIVSPLTPPALARLQEALAERGLTIVSGGKFHTVMGAQSNKGTAVTHLTDLFRRELGPVTTIGLGDSANDRPLLAAVERPFLVQKPGGTWQPMDLDVQRVQGVGPRGWRNVIDNLLGGS